MARLSKADLFDRVTSAIQSGGWNFLILSDSHPFELIVYRDLESYSTRIYIWRVTHGGGAARAADEYRIQVTSGVTRFSRAGVDRTLVLGWWEEIEVFVGFDVAHHAGALGSSPSLQVQEGALRKAGVDRVATYRKSNEEIAIAFVPSFLGDYISQAPALHEIARSRADLAAFNAVVADPNQTDRHLDRDASDKRRMVLAEVARQLRDASFRERVLTAYSRQCAMCGVQLKVLDAAHILPAAKSSNDSTSNGLALCALHHRAFDRALLTVRPDYRLAINPIVLDGLARAREVAGLDQFRALLRSQILLPPDKRDRPDPTMIRQANALRGWSSYDLVA
jgi:putative restriction endonuclease